MEMKTLTIEENAINYVCIENNTYFHKQIEFKNGKTFMRIKKRALVGTA